MGDFRVRKRWLGEMVFHIEVTDDVFVFRYFRLGWRPRGRSDMCLVDMQACAMNRFEIVSTCWVRTCDLFDATPRRLPFNLKEAHYTHGTVRPTRIIREGLITGLIIRIKSSAPRCERLNQSLLLSYKKVQLQRIWCC